MVVTPIVQQGALKSFRRVKPGAAAPGFVLLGTQN
jgi:hypothetical protein